MSGGGGSNAGGGSAGTGTVHYAKYLEDYHKIWIKDIDNVLDPHGGPGAGDTSPYVNAEAWNPGDNLEEVQRSYDDYKELVEPLDEIEDYSRLRSTGVAQTAAETRFAWPTLLQDVESRSDVDERLSPERLIALVDQLRGLDSALDYESIVDRVNETIGVRNLLDPEEILKLAKRLAGLDELELEQLTETAMSLVDQVVFPSTYIDEVMARREEAEQASLAKQQGGLSGMLAQQGAVMSSAFVLGHALIMSEFLSRQQLARSELELQAHRDRATLFAQMLEAGRVIAQSRIELPLQFAATISQILNLRMSLITAAVDQVSKLAMSGVEGKNSTLSVIADLEKSRYNYLLQAVAQVSQMEVYKLTYVNQAVDDMFRMLSHKISSGSSSVQLLGEVKRIANVAMSEFYNRDVELNVADHNWPLEVWQYGANLLASIHGAAATYGQDMKNKNASALGGGISTGISGALTGASIGMAGGPWGAAAGAVIGGAGGYFLGGK